MLTLLLVGACVGMASAIYPSHDIDPLLYEPHQMHISQGKSPEYMTISWTTNSSCDSEVRFGLDPEELTEKTFGDSSTYSYQDYHHPLYVGGFYHHATLPSLKPDTTYYYRAGDFIQNTVSAVRSFKTTHAPGDLRPMSLGVVGDLGQTVDSYSTLDHLIANKQMSLILHVGDLGYADCDQTKWDTYGNMTEVLASRMPWMVGAGNHEIEGNDSQEYFVAFENRYRMNPERPAVFGDVTIPAGYAKDGSMYCAPSVFQMQYDYGNSFYAFNAGGVHSIFLNCYSWTDSESEQYQWLERDLKSVEREMTPWIVVTNHCPLYNSNTAHYEEKHAVAMRNDMEALFLKYHINVVLGGHVHAYERSHPVFQGNVTADGPIYVTIGDGGNAEGHASGYHEPQPAWSAFRNGTQYGHGLLHMYNASHLKWEWHRNIDGERVLSDSVMICNTALGANADCSAN